jgi:inosose dehydratase
MTVRIATGPDSWGVWFPDDPKQTPWHRCLDEIAAAGYEALEIAPYGYLPTDSAELRAELRKRGLKATAGSIMQDLHVPSAWETLAPDLARVVDQARAVEATHLVVLADWCADPFTGQARFNRSLTDDEWSRLLETLTRIARYAAARGLATAFHPHADTPVESVNDVERLLRGTAKDDLTLCLDTGHIAYRGGNPLEIIRRFPDRIGYLHLKSVDPTIRDQVNQEHLSFAAAVSRGIFPTLDRGVVDFVALRDALDAIGFDGWAVVEQDMYPASPDKPAPIARHNRDYLRSISLG